MARHYYDRHQAVEITTWDWTKYNAIGHNSPIYHSLPPSYLGAEWNRYPLPKAFTYWSGYTWDGSKFVGTGTPYYASVGGRPGHGRYYIDPQNKVGTKGVFLVGEQTPTQSSGSYVLYLSTFIAEVDENAYYTKGSYITTLTGQTYNYKQHDKRNPDGFWWVRGSSATSYGRGDFIETIIAEQGEFPANGFADGYWYVLGKRAFPELKIRQDGQLKTSADGWVRIDGQLRQIQQMWARVNGQLKEI